MPLPLLLPLILGGAAGLGKIASGISAGNAAAKAEANLKARRDKAERQYLHDKNTDFLDTATAKSTLSALRKQNDRQMEANNNNSIRQGASDEAKVAMAGQLNENYADAASRLAGFGTQYKQQIEDRHLRRLDSLDDALYNSQLNKPSALGMIGDAFGTLGGSALSAYGQGAFTKTPTTTNTAPIWV